MRSSIHDVDLDLALGQILCAMCRPTAHHTALHPAGWSKKGADYLGDGRAKTNSPHLAFRQWRWISGVEESAERRKSVYTNQRLAKPAGGARPFGIMLMWCNVRHLCGVPNTEKSEKTPLFAKPLEQSWATSPHLQTPTYTGEEGTRKRQQQAPKPADLTRRWQPDLYNCSVVWSSTHQT